MDMADVVESNVEAAPATVYVGPPASAAVQAGAPAPATVQAGAPARRKPRRTDSIFHGVALAVALGMVAILAAIVAVLAMTAWPALGQLGFGFLTGTVWNPFINAYGALPFIAGTAITTALALLLAVPVSLGIAILLTEYASRWLALAIGLVIDVAAGIPTIVFGAWALLALVPFLHSTGLPAIATVLGWIPFLNPADRPSDLSGYGMFTTGLVLAAMVFPTIVAVTRNAFLATPHELRDASLGLGATRWETATRVVLRQSRPGLLGAVILACGRALGETMAVVYVIGTVPRLPLSVFDQGHTLAAQLLTQVYGGGAVPGSLTTAALYELGLILLALSLATSLGGRMLARLAGAATLVGGGR